MRRDLWSMEKKDVIHILTSITHCNIYYNERKKYKHIYNEIEAVVGSQYKKELWCLIVNTARAIKYRAKGLAVPRDFAPYKANPQKISHKRMVKLVDTLESLGYIDIYTGGIVDWHKMLTVGSANTFNQSWIDLFIGVDVQDEEDSFDPVIVKDRESGEVKSTRGQAGVKFIREYLTKFNLILQGTEFSSPDSEHPVQQYKRVFSDNMKSGGRHYNSCGGLQTMSGDDRLKLKINGEAVSELDFKAMHVSLLYEEELVTNKDVVESWISDEWGGEYKPYNVEMPFLEVDQDAVNYFRSKYGKGKHDPIRNLAKHALMVSLNAQNYRSAFQQVTREVVSDQKRIGTDTEDQCKFYGIKVGNSFPGHTVCQAVQLHNKPIAEHFFSDQGIRLQYLDSEIMACVINRLICEDEPLLPEHDSVIVRQSIKEKVKEYMHEAYLEVMGSDMFCFVEEK